MAEYRIYRVMRVTEVAVVGEHYNAKSPTEALEIALREDGPQWKDEDNDILLYQIKDAEAKDLLFVRTGDGKSLKHLTQVQTKN